MYETMKIIVILLVCKAVVGQDYQYSQPLELESRAGYTISHGEGKSSVNVNLHSGPSTAYHQPEAIQLGSQDALGGELQYQGIKSPESSGYYQVPTQSYLSDLATKQYLNINPTNAKPDIISQQPQQQLYNVGYSINIENSAPKLTYRSPMPKNAHSYRQQKLLNAEVITGTHKDTVAKPTYDFAASNAQSSPNYITIDPKGQYAPNYADKQSVTKVYSDVRNTHGYTWKTLSPGVEISGYHGFNDALSNQQQSQAHQFDHAAALGRSQGFDISNVIDNGNRPYKKPAETEAYDINKALSESSEPKAQISQVSQIPAAETSDNHEFDTSSLKTSSGISQSLDTSSLTDFKYPSQEFGAQSGGEFLNFGNNPFKHNLLSSSNIEVDKSLLENFYKNYNPVFYQPEVTLPIPNLPKNIKINLHEAASRQYPTYNLKFQSSVPHFQNSILANPKSQAPNPQLMVNQHYAFVQASSLGSPYQQPSDDVKPVQEPQQEDSYGQQSQKQIQQVAPLPSINTNPIPKEQKQKNLSEHKKFHPQPIPIPVRQYGRPVPVPVYMNEKNYRMKNLRPPPMIFIHQKY